MVQAGSDVDWLCLHPVIFFKQYCCKKLTTIAVFFTGFLALFGLYSYYTPSFHNAPDMFKTPAYEAVSDSPPFVKSDLVNSAVVNTLPAKALPGVHIKPVPPQSSLVKSPPVKSPPVKSAPSSPVNSPPVKSPPVKSPPVKSAPSSPVKAPPVKAPPVKSAPAKSAPAKRPQPNLFSSQMMEQLPLFRDLYSQEVWPEISREDSVLPDQLPSTVHYVWCGQNQVFRFEHYLPILSTLRLLKPLKVIFHYSHLPVPDRLGYHAWFWELKQSLASLELKRLEPKHRNCDARQLTRTALRHLSQTGGLYIAPTALLTRIPKDMAQQKFWYNSVGGNTPVIISARAGFNLTLLTELVVGAKNRSLGTECGSVESYNQHGAVDSPPCLVLTNQIKPKDVITTRTPFAELARWFYYGKRKVLEAKPSTKSSIPRIAHITWLKRPRSSSKPKFHFFHFLSILSALHVAGLRHVYIYGDVRPEGEWWGRLKGENVTYVPIDAIGRVFQQPVMNPAHRSDVIRAHLLRSYGGVYMDGDVLWVNPIPDNLLRYPTVACPDWPSRGEWPAAFNIGVLMSQSDSPWLRHFLASLRRYLDSIWFFNAIMVPYRVYERYPESLHIDTHLQVICFRGICHPTWQKDYIRDIDDKRPSRDFDWREGRAFHFTVPKPHKTLTSPEEIRKKLDIFAEMGQRILTKSGWGSLIEET